MGDVITVIEALTGELGKWVAAALVALITGASLWLKGRASMRAKVKAQADADYRKTIRKMSHEDAVMGDDPAVLRDSLRKRGQLPGGL